MAIELNKYLKNGVAPVSPITPANWASSLLQGATNNGAGYWATSVVDGSYAYPRVIARGANQSYPARSELLNSAANNAWKTLVNVSGKKGWLLWAMALDLNSQYGALLRITIDGVLKSPSSSSYNSGVGAVISTESGNTRLRVLKPINFNINSTMSDEEKAWCLGAIASSGMGFETSLKVEINMYSGTLNGFADYVFEEEL